MALRASILAATLLACVVPCSGVGTPPIRVAVYAGEGTMPVEPDLLPCLRASDDLAAATVDGRSIRAGALADYDVIVFPAGMSSAQSAALGPAGRQRVQEFVRDGGGYIGICAGAYLALTGEHGPRTDRLELLAAASIDPWRRGEGLVRMRPSDGTPGCQLDYQNGPVMKLVEREGVPPATVLAHYGEATRGLLRSGIGGGIGVIAGDYGRGRVLLFGPHPERRPGCGWVLRQGVRWSARRAERSGDETTWSTAIPPLTLTIPSHRVPSAVRRAIQSIPAFLYLQRMADVVGAD
ncbi:MAG: hypothetical protein GF320_00575 [Armatimonadia bacterium]|nr:hypothetical protein [Armatimonadia bacterium]